MGEFAYNKSTSSDAPWGAIKRLDRYENGVLSTLYIVFSIKNQREIDSDYLTVFFDTDRWHKGVSERAAEGARNHGMLNIAVDDFFRIKITMPETEEQKEIAKILRVADHEIDLLQKSIEAEKQKKKALMQLLLMGKARVEDEQRQDG